MRRLLSRPISEQPLVGVAILGVVAVLAAVVAVTSSRQGSPNPASTPVVGANTNSQTGGNASTAPPAPSDPDQVRGVTQQFLAGYLPWRYQQPGANVSLIQAASPDLVRQLQAERTRPVPAQQELQPHVLDVHVTMQSPTTALSAADIDDGSGGPYAIRMTVTRQAGDWQVVSLNDD